MKSNKLVSVIIPVFNVAPFLTEALNSVLNQTYTALEIIIVDDGSTDSSGQICEDYAKMDDRIRVIHQKNAGLSAARNTGLNMLTGEAVAFLDPDDAYRPDYIQKMTDVLFHQKADAVVCKYTIHITNGIMRQTGKDKVATKIDEGLYDRSFALRALAEETLNHIVWNKITPASVWANVRFPDGHVYEDIDTTYRIINQCNKICVLDEPLYMKRTRPGSITEVCSKRNIYDWLLAHHHFETFVSANIPDVFTLKHKWLLQQKRLRKMIFSYANYALTNGNGDAFSVKLRDYIVNTGPFIGIGKCTLPLKVGFWMICRCPTVFRVACGVYFPVRHFSRMVFGRQRRLCRH